MNYRPIACFALLTLAFAAQAESNYAPLQPVSECLDPSRARSFQLLDNSRLLVDAGRRFYLIELSWACPELGSQHRLEFSSRQVSGRICGSIGESINVGAAGGANILGRCDIARVIRLSKEEWAAELRAR